MMKRKAVPAYDSETVTLADGASLSPVETVSSPYMFTASPLASVNGPGLVTA